MCKRLAQATEQHSKKSMQWMQQLIAKGAHGPIVSLDSSARARLGPNVDRLVRCLQKVQHCQSPPEGENVFRVDTWSTKDLIVDGVASLFDLVAVSADQSMAAVAGVKEAVGFMSGKAVASMKDLAHNLHEVKTDSLLCFHNDSAIVKACLEKNTSSDGGFPQETAPEEVHNMINKYNNENQRTTDAMAARVKRFSDDRCIVWLFRYIKSYI